MARFSWLIVALAATATGLIQPGPSGLRDLIARAPIMERQSQDNQTGPLECFEVAGPVLAPQGLVTGSQIVAASPVEDAPSCEVVLMDHHFANSYGQPFVGNYTPPENCPFNRVVLNLTVVSEGRQFDRLAILYLGDTELWRTSTSEPKPDPGIAWTTWKDTTPFLSLWRQPQTLIFDLGNVVDSTYTGLFNTTLTATFFEGSLAGPQAWPADLIVPVSAGNGKNGGASSFTFPEVLATSNVTLPRNIRRAVFSVAATGQAAEEFWWSNVPQSSAYVFNSSAGPLPALSSFREVRVGIDGHIAGLSWPFPVVFTGGISPPLHRPIAGIEAYDLREQEIDISPWLGLLCDGKEHTFNMEVVGVDDTNEPTFSVVPMYWVLTGKIFIWLDKDENSVTTGDIPRTSVNDINYRAVQDVQTNVSLAYNQTIDRTIVVKSKIQTQQGETEVTWAQKFSMFNDGSVDDLGQSQVVNANYGGEHKAIEDEFRYFATHYNYPVSTNYKYKGPDGTYYLSLTADLSQGLQLAVTGMTVFASGLDPFLPLLPERVAGVAIDNVRNGTSFFYQLSKAGGSSGFGSTHQVYRLGTKSLLDSSDPSLALDQLLYSRDVTVVNETTTADSTYVYESESMPRVMHNVPSSSKATSFAPVLGKQDGLLSIFNGKDAMSQSKDAKPKANAQSSDGGDDTLVDEASVPSRGQGGLAKRNRLLGDW